MSEQALAHMLSRAEANPDLAQRMAPLREQLRVIEPLLVDHIVHAPFWAVVANRVD